jgi:hypothetical protein
VHAGQPANGIVEFFPWPWHVHVPAGQVQTTEQFDPNQDELHPPSVSDVPPPPLSLQLSPPPLPEPDPLPLLEPDPPAESGPVDASGVEPPLEVSGASNMPPLEASVAPESLIGGAFVAVEPPQARAIAAPQARNVRVRVMVASFYLSRHHFGSR